MKTETKAVSTAAKLPVEQLEILRVVNANKVNARQLEKLLWRCRPLEADEFSQDIYNCISIILLSVDELNAEEVTSVAKLFEFARLLQDLPMMAE